MWLLRSGDRSSPNAACAKKNLDRTGIDPRSCSGEGLENEVWRRPWFPASKFQPCPPSSKMSSHAAPQYHNRRRSTSKPYKRPSGSYPAHPDWPDGVTIGLRVQYAGSKADRFSRQHEAVEVPGNLMREVREDLTAIRFGTASPKNGNAHFSSRLPGGVDIVWPAYKVRLKYGP